MGYIIYRVVLGEMVRKVNLEGKRWNKTGKRGWGPGHVES